VAHVAFEVDDLEAASAGHNVIIEPNSPGPGVLVAMIEVDGPLSSSSRSTARSSRASSHCARTARGGQALGGECSTNRCAIQRHRQRPQAPRQHEALRSRAGARGTAEGGSGRADAAQRAAGAAAPRGRSRSVRRTATVRSTFLCGCRRTADDTVSVGRPQTETGLAPGLLRSAGGPQAVHGSHGRRPAPSRSSDQLRRTARPPGRPCEQGPTSAARGAPPSPFRHLFRRVRCESVRSAAVR
jgi:hypothetical protein